MISIGCRKWTRATCCVTLYTELDDQCDKLAVGRSKVSYTNVIV